MHQKAADAARGAAGRRMGALNARSAWIARARPVWGCARVATLTAGRTPARLALLASEKAIAIAAGCVEREKVLCV